MSVRLVSHEFSERCLDVVDVGFVVVVFAVVEVVVVDFVTVGVTTSSWIGLRRVARVKDLSLFKE